MKRVTLMPTFSQPENKNVEQEVELHHGLLEIEKGPPSGSLVSESDVEIRPSLKPQEE